MSIKDTRPSSMSLLTRMKNKWVAHQIKDQIKQIGIIVSLLTAASAPTFAATRTVTVRVEWGSPVTIAQFNLGDRVRIQAQLISTDVTVPETIEHEDLQINLSSGGLAADVSLTDAVNTFQIDKVAPDTSGSAPTLTAYISGYDGDEYANVTITVNPVDPLPKSASQIDHWRELAEAFEQGELAAEAAEKLCPPIKVCEQLESAIGLGYAAQANYFEKLANDPPDPNFTQIALPIVASVPVLAADPSAPTAVIDSANALLANERQSAGLLQAILTSINRASGAIAASDTVWQQRQTQAAASYFLQLSDLVAKQPALRLALQNAWTAAGLPSIAPTANDVHNAQLNLFSNGFSADKQQQLLQLGLSADDITHLKNVLIALDYNEIATLASFPSVLTDSITLQTLSLGAQSLSDIVVSNATPLTAGQRIFGLGIISNAASKPVAFGLKAKMTADSHGSAQLTGGLLLWDSASRLLIDQGTVTKASYLGNLAIVEGTYHAVDRNTGTFKAIVTDNGGFNTGKDTFEITLSNGYHVKGTLGFGDVKIVTSSAAVVVPDTDTLRLP